MTSEMSYPITDEISRQGIDVRHDYLPKLGIHTRNFICASCTHHIGGCRCDAGVFIAFEGGNLSACVFYDRECRHCHKIT